MGNVGWSISGPKLEADSLDVVATAALIFLFLYIFLSYVTNVQFLWMLVDGSVPELSSQLLTWTEESFGQCSAGYLHIQ